MKKGEFKTSNRKNEEKDEFEYLKMSPWCSKGVSQLCFDT
jgi:hypothetical protein